MRRRTTRVAVRGALALLLVATAVAAAPSPPEALAVSGRVHAADGEPLAGATVELLPREDPLALGRRFLGVGEEPAALATATTGDDGRYRLAAPAPGLYRLRATARGRGALSLVLPPLVEPYEAPPAELEAERRQRLEVVGERGPLAGAAVAVFEVEPFLMELGLRAPRSRFGEWVAEPALATTGDDGAVELVLAARDPLVLHAAAAGHLPAQVVLERTARRRVDLAAAPAHPLHLRRGDGPATGALVYDRDAALPFAVAGDDGVVSVPLSRGTERGLRVLAAEGVAEPVVAWEASAPERERADRVTLGPAPWRDGVVVDATGTPVAGALAWWLGDPESVVESGVGGGFRVRALPLPQGIVDPALAAGARGHLAARADDLGEGREARVELRGAAAIVGTVRDAAGDPVSGATLGVAPIGGRPDSGLLATGAPRAASDAAGRFRLAPLPAPGSPVVQAAAPGFAPWRGEVPALAPGEERRLVIELAAGRRVTGLVVDGAESPVPGAAVEVEESGDVRRGLAAYSAVTGSDGTFALADLAPGPHDVRVTAAGFAPLEVPALEVPDAPESELGTFVLAPGVEVAGSVVDAAGAAIADVAIAAGGHFTVGGPVADPDAVTDAAGRFVLVDLAPGRPLHLVASRAGYAEQRVGPLTPPLDMPLEIVLAAAATIAGRVVDEAGEAIAGATVFSMGSAGTGAGRRMATTDTSGAFRLDGLPAAALRVMAMAEDRPGVMREVTTTAGETVSLTLEMSRGAELRGTVRRADGSPAPGARVFLAGGDYGGATKSGVDGGYRLPGLAVGSAVVRAVHEADGEAARTVEIGPGENEADLALDPGVAVRGHVVGPDGGPVAGARLTLADVQPGPLSPAPRRAVSDRDGTFALAAVTPGAYRLVAESAGLATWSSLEAMVVAATAPEPIEVRMGAGATVVGRVTGVDPVAVDVQAGLEGEDYRSGAVDHQGMVRIENVGIGSYVLRAWTGDGRQASRPVTVAEGDQLVEVELDFEVGFTLRGAVLLDDAPLAYAAVAASGGAGGGHATSDPAGRFAISGLAAGDYDVRVSEPGGKLLHRGRIALDSDHEVTIELAAARLAGEAVDADTGEPLAGVLLLLRQPDAGANDGPAVAFAWSDSAGRFTLRHAATGRHVVRATREGYEPVELVVELVSGEERDGVRLALAASRGSLRFTVVCPGVSCPRTLTAVLAAGDGTSLARHDLPLPADGAVELADVSPAIRDLWLTASGFAAVSRPVGGPGDAGVVTLVPGGRLEVTVPELTEAPATAHLRVVGAAGTHRWGGWSRFRDETPLDHGRATVDALAPGEVDVVVEAADGRTWSGVATVVAGSTVRLELR